MVHQDTLTDLVIDGETIRTTEDHPFWSVTDQMYEDAQDLAPGEQVLTADGRVIEVIGLDTSSAGEGTAYNLTVDDIHTYYVGHADVLVHNTGDSCGTGGAAAVRRNSAGQAIGTDGRYIADPASTVPKVGRRPTASVRRAADEAATDADGVMRCQACGTELTPHAGAPNSREFDHILPYSRGGGRGTDNIWDLCRTCNRQKSAKTLDEWDGYP